MPLTPYTLPSVVTLGGLFLVGGYLFVSTLSDLQGELREEAILAKVEQAPVGSLLSDVREASKKDRTNIRLATEYSRQAVGAALGAKDPLTLLCESISALNRVRALQPTDVNSYLALADVKQLLSGQASTPETICSSFASSAGVLAGHITSRSPRELVQRAIELAPSGSSELYLAALITLRLGDRGEAFKLFRRNEEHNPLFTVEQRQFVMELVQTEAELKEAIPRRYPENLWWISSFWKNRRDDMTSWQNTFTESLQASIRELNTRWSSGSLNTKSYINYLSAIGNEVFVQLHDPARQELDRALSTALRESSPKLSQLYQFRSNLKRLSMVKGITNDDRLPSRTSVGPWLSELGSRNGTLSGAGGTVGVYLPTKSSPRLLMIEGSNWQLTGSELELFAGEDNQTFQKLRPGEGVVLTGLAGGLYYQELSDIPGRILKIRAGGDTAKALATNSLRQLVQVYGE